mmetsp:Transcript_54322/g.138021  ORF Transcript_54322/g.138021 Transcript_54322/m.138021 type:complete len:299 (-) Transcript_54322:2730-3626(-)
MQAVTRSMSWRPASYSKRLPQAWFTWMSRTTRMPRAWASRVRSRRSSLVPKPESTEVGSDVQEPWYSPRPLWKIGESDTTVMPMRWRYRNRPLTPCKSPPCRQESMFQASPFSKMSRWKSCRFKPSFVMSPLAKRSTKMLYATSPCQSFGDTMRLYPVVWKSASASSKRCLALATDASMASVFSCRGRVSGHGGRGVVVDRGVVVGASVVVSVEVEDVIVSPFIWEARAPAHCCKSDVIVKLRYKSLNVTQHVAVGPERSGSMALRQQPHWLQDSMSGDPSFCAYSVQPTLPTDRHHA